MEWIYGNGIAEIGGKIFFLSQLVCGHVIAEIGGICGNCGNAIAINQFFFFFSNQLLLFFSPPLYFGNVIATNQLQ